MPREITEKSFQAIIAIVNNGFSSIVMDAAREAGCRGGTIIHARGTGHLKTEKQYGIIVTPDKEFIVMLVADDIVDAVLSAVNDVVGIKTDGHGIVFALPAEHVAGIKF